MAYLLLVTLLLLLFIHFFIYKIDWLSPTIMSICTLLVSLSLLIININEWGISINIQTYFTIIGGVLVLSVGEITAKSKYHRRTNLFEEKNSPIKQIKLIAPSKSFTNFIIIYMMITLIWYFLSIRSIVFMSGIDGATLIGAYRAAEKNLNFILQLCLTINLSLAYYFLLSFIEHYVFTGKKIIRYLIPVGIYLISSILSSGRMNILYLFATIIIFSYISYHQKNGWNLKFNINIVKKFIIAGMISLGLFYLLGYLTGKSNVHGFYYTISLYIGSPIAALSNYLENFQYSFSDFGNETLIGVNNILEIIGIDLAVADQRILDFVHLGNMPSRTNIYTSFRRVINDYGYFGMLMYQFLLGLILTTMYQKIKRFKWKNIKFGIIMYSYLFRYFIFQFVDERILMNIFSLTTMAQITVFWLLLRYFTRYKEISYI